MKTKTGMLQIKRVNEVFAILRKLDVYLNDEKVGGIANGKIFEIELETADYEVYVKMDWCTSPVFAFTMELGQIIKLESFVNDADTFILPKMIFKPKEFFALRPITDKAKRKNSELF